MCMPVPGGTLGRVGFGLATGGLSEAGGLLPLAKALQPKAPTVSSSNPLAVPTADPVKMAAPAAGRKVGSGYTSDPSIGLQIQ